MANQAADGPDLVEPFDAAALQTDFAFLAECPDSLFDDIMALPVGGLKERVAGIVAWRDALLRGRLPSAKDWPHAAATGVRETLDDLGIVRFCEEQPDLVDELLADVLDAFRCRAVALDELRIRLRELEQLARSRGLERKVVGLADKWQARYVADEGGPGADEGALAQLRRDLQRDTLQRLASANAALVEAWEARVSVWTAIADVFGDLGMLLGRGWDLARGILWHVGWREALALRDLLERLPQLREIVRSLGRMQASESPDTESVANRLFAPVRQVEEERRENRTPLVPEDTKGVELSDDIPRMLPSEAAMLGHPVLRYLWHARRSERALLTYRLEGVEVQRLWVEREGVVEHPAPRYERGPIVAVIDTSGSMHGTPETVAKALVLEALRTALAERRRCYVYAFSGPGQTAGHEMGLSSEGVGRLLDFLSMSFHGGTDPREVMRLVVKRLLEPEWKNADILFASDGEWPAPRGGAVTKIQQARDAGTRFHGVQIGQRGTTGMAAICDPVHEFDGWLDIA